MRYDEIIKFYHLGDEVYDPNTGQMSSIESFSGERLCAAYDLSTEEKMTLLGRINVRAMMVHHRGKKIQANALLYDGDWFWIRSSKVFRNKISYLVEAKKDEN